MTVRLDRLTTLANYLDTIEEEDFYLGSWKCMKRFNNPECGTKACAIGHACDIPEFKEAGLSLRLVPDFNYKVPVYEGQENWRAVEAFFDMTDEDTQELFYWTGYDGDIRVPPSRVAAKIRAFIQAQSAA